MRKPYIWVGLALAAVLVTGYFVSPLFALNNLKSAARSGDRDRLAQAIDFPSVRQSLKDQMRAHMLASMTQDPEMRDNPFAGLALAMAPVLIDQAIDGMVTPETMATIVETGKPQPGAPAAEPAGSAPTPSQPAPAAEEPEISYGYVDLGTFKATMNLEGGAKTALVFKRSGLFGWRLTRIDLPLPAFEAPTALGG